MTRSAAASLPHEQATTPFSPMAMLKDLVKQWLLPKNDLVSLVPAVRKDLAFVRDAGRTRLEPRRLATSGRRSSAPSRILEGADFGLVLGEYRVLDRLGSGSMGNRLSRRTSDLSPSPSPSRFCRSADDQDPRCLLETLPQRNRNGRPAFASAHRRGHRRGRRVSPRRSGDRAPLLRDGVPARRRPAAASSSMTGPCRWCRLCRMVRPDRHRRSPRRISMGWSIATSNRRRPRHQRGWPSQAARLRSGVLRSAEYRRKRERSSAPSITWAPSSSRTRTASTTAPICIRWERCSIGASPANRRSRPRPAGSGGLLGAAGRGAAVASQDPARIAADDRSFGAAAAHAASGRSHRLGARRRARASQVRGVTWRQVFQLADS